LQLLGRPLDEARILQIAHAYEQSTDWHKARPPIAVALHPTGLATPR
jgi:aspartyl-tRNA(Asn)/glutamyl-tRNA(Gln) amidotransferase subunit A